MFSKLKEQLPALIITIVVVLAIGFGLAWWFQSKTITDLKASQQAELAKMSAQNAADLRAANDESNRRIEAVSALLRDAIQKRASDAFMTDSEFQKANADRINQLATAIAAKMQPYNPLPKSPEEAERMQTEQIDRVSSRMADKINPILVEMAKDQNLTRDQITTYSQRIGDMIGTALTGEITRNQKLNNNIAATQAVARDSLRFAQEVTARYGSRQNKEIQQQLADQLHQLDLRLISIENQAPGK